MNESIDILVMGDVMIDIDVSVPLLDSLIDARGSDLPTLIQMTQGGSAANTAMWLTLSGHRVHFLGSVGNDSAGVSATATLKNHGMIPLLKINPDYPTGMCLVITESDGGRTMLPSSGSNAHLSVTDLETLWPTQDPAHFHLSAYSLFHEITSQSALHALRRASASNVTVSIDPSSHALIPPHSEMILESLGFADVLLANLEEAETLYKVSQGRSFTSPPTREQVLHELVGLLNPDSTITPIVVVTLGEGGAIAVKRGGSVEYAAAHHIDSIISTAGAGDAFNAGFLTSWLRHTDNLQLALEHGNQTAARALTRVGASPETQNS